MTEKDETPEKSSDNAERERHRLQQQQNRVCANARRAERAGRLTTAIAGYRAAVLLDTSNPTPYLYLGFALQQNQQTAAALQVYSLAADLDQRVTNAWRDSGVEEDVRRRSRTADQAIRQHFTALHRRSMDSFQQQVPAADIERIRGAIWCQTHATAFQYNHENQRPHLFYVPDLAPVAVFDETALPWTARLENACDDILAEFQALSQARADQQTPYLDASLKLGGNWKPLLGSLNWGSFFLYRNGRINESIKAFVPRTLAVLNAIDTLKIAGSPREVVFSILRPGQHIPPHYGVANTDATVHLPLLIAAEREDEGSKKCGIRVTDTTHLWRQGEAFAFDDSFEHESWNRSASVRVNLLFEAWHPDLSQPERNAVQAAFAARDAWNRQRRI